MIDHIAPPFKFCHTPVTPILQDVFMKLGRSFYLQPTKTVARELLGKDLVVRNKNRIKKYKIVETEAYLGVRDRACHSYNGRRTDRTEVMYLEGGHSYVYFIYGMYYCFNV